MSEFGQRQNGPAWPPFKNVAKRPCLMASTCEAVGSCLYPHNACLSGPEAANDIPARSIDLERISND